MRREERYRTWASGIVLGAAVFLLAACSALPTTGTAPDAPFYTVRDSLGREVVLDKKPQRIVLLTASFVNMMHAVGGDFVAWANSPSDEGALYARGKKTVGYTYQVDMEALLAEKPDLVIGLPGLHNRLQQSLEENRIPLLLLSLSRFADVKRAVTILADVSGRKEAGQAVIAEMERDMEETAAKVPQTAYRFAVIHGTAQSVTIECKGSIACDTAERLGLKNAFGDLQPPEGGSQLPFSMEQLVEKDPDILFLTTMVMRGKEQAAFKDNLMGHPSWRALKAVREGRVYFLPQKYFLISPGVEYPKALQFMAQQLYPEQGLKGEG
mgnify:CR=1 FL=1